MLWPPIPWKQLAPKIRSAPGGVANEKDAREFLRALREKGQSPW